MEMEKNFGTLCIAWAVGFTLYILIVGFKTLCSGEGRSYLCLKRNLMDGSIPAYALVFVGTL